MKKYVLVLMIMIAASFSVFSQEQTEETKTEAQGQYSLGIALSGLGIEPIFQYRNGNMEMQAGIAFTNFGLFTDEFNYKVIAPKFDLGYSVFIEDLSMNISTGIANGVMFCVGNENLDFDLMDVFAIYLKVSEKISNFEIGTKVYFPLLALDYNFAKKTGSINFAACNTSGLLMTLVGITVEGKILIQ